MHHNFDSTGFARLSTFSIILQCKFNLMVVPELTSIYFNRLRSLCPFIQLDITLFLFDLSLSLSPRYLSPSFLLNHLVFSSCSVFLYLLFSILFPLLSFSLSLSSANSHFIEILILLHFHRFFLSSFSQSVSFYFNIF